MAERKLIGLVHSPRVPEAAHLLHSIMDSLGIGERWWVASAAELDVDADTLEKTSVIITAGGDGTILRVVRVASPHRVPIVGINLGRVGFMTELSVEEALEKIPAYLDGGQRVEERMMLQASLLPRSGNGPRFVAHALNDVIVTRGALPRLLDINASVDNVPLTSYRADGLIVATATGSTGYALSAGGPVLYPESQMLLLQPIATHMSLQTGLVLEGGSVVELEVTGEVNAVLTVDGFNDTPMGSDDKVVIQRSPHVTRFLRASPSSAFYYDLARRLGAMDQPGPAGTDR